jgi:putative ABC transport system permease protein
VETTGNNKTAVEDRVKAALKELSTTSPITVSWLADDLDKANSQAATISLLGFLSFIAISIATLGLLGLVVYTVEVKSKEISIRKIIGAGEKQIINICQTGFIKLLFIAGLIAMPIGWLLAKMFLQNFSVRTKFDLVNVLTVLFVFACNRLVYNHFSNV